MSANKGDLRVWWVPQVPGKPFHVNVKTTEEASLILQTLADYDLFQFENKIKPDYCNAGGLEVYDTEPEDERELSWLEWYNEDGEDINDIMRPTHNGSTTDLEESNSMA